MFYGLVHIFEWELGYFTLSQLEEIKFFNGQLGLERDLYFESGSTIREVVGDEF